MDSFSLEPQDIGTLSDLVFHQPEAHDYDVSLTPSAESDRVTIRHGKIHLVSVDNEDLAADLSLGVGLQLHTKASVLVLSFAGNNDRIPLNLHQVKCDPEASRMLVFRSEKFTFYENGRERLLKKYLGNQQPDVLIINMIDWAVMTDRHKIRFAAELARIADHYGCAIVCFTMETNERIKRARETGRGWLGILARLSVLSFDTAQKQNTADRSATPQKQADLAGVCKFSDPQENPPARIAHRSELFYDVPKTALEQVPFEQLTHIPIEQRFPESDWYREWAVESPHISKIVRELEFKKKHGMLRLDPGRLKEYEAGYPEFYKKFKDLYCAATGELEIYSM